MLGKSLISQCLMREPVPYWPLAVKLLKYIHLPEGTFPAPCAETPLREEKESSFPSAGERRERSLWALSLREPAFDLLSFCLVFLYVV